MHRWPMTVRMAHRASSTPFLSLILFAAGCGGGLGPADLDRIEFGGGNGRIATVGTATDPPPAVRALSIDGLPIPGVSVTFAIVSGGGSVTGASATTGEDGVATAGNWVLGTTVGPNTLTASAGGMSLTFDAVGLVSAASTVEKVDGDLQTATAGRPVPVSPMVRVRDEFGNVIGNETVTFALGGTGGTIGSPTSTTDAMGFATATAWTLGAAPATYQLTATAGTGSASFDAIGVAGPVTVSVAAGDSQVGVVGQVLPVAPLVLVTDAQGLPFAGAPVAFGVVMGGGSVGADTVLTNASGLAVTPWTLGTVAGSNAVTATIAGVGAAQFFANGTPDAPQMLVVLRGNGQFGKAGSDTPFPPTVIVQDQYGNGVPNTSVSFTVTGGGGGVTDPVAPSDASGIAHSTAWTLGALGVNSLEATITTDTAVFTATALADVYDIDLVRLGGGNPAVTQAIDNAVARWKTFVIGDLVDVSFTSSTLDAGTCGTGTPEVNDVVDDLRLFLTIEFIDGPGSILGSAGPCAVRDSSDGGLTVVGAMLFDIDDLDNLASQGILTDVMIHEIGHVVGIGTLWDDFGFLQNPSLVTTGADTHFNGPLAIAAFDSLGGSGFQQSKVPVENTQGGQGTLDSHWRESVLDKEAMTGFIDQGSNPFSLISVQSVADLGYVVNTDAADPFTLFSPSPARTGATSTSKIELVDDVNLGPIYIVTRNGRITGVFRP